MIELYENKNYYILVDGQDGTFMGSRIYESLHEIKEQFNEYGNMDGLGEKENEVLNKWTIEQCLSHWTMNLKKYDGADFQEVINEKELNYIKYISNKNNMNEEKKFENVRDNLEQDIIFKRYKNLEEFNKYIKEKYDFTAHRIRPQEFGDYNLLGEINKGWGYVDIYFIKDRQSNIFITEISVSIE